MPLEADSQPAPLELGEGADLDRIPPAVRESLALGLTERPRDRSAASLLELLRRPAAVSRLLHALPDEALYPAAVLAFIARASVTRLHEHLTLRLGADTAVQAVAALERVGLVQYSAYEPRQIWIAPTVQAALRPHLAPLLRFEGEVPALEIAEHDIPQRLFEDAVLLAALAGLSPKLTQGGEVFKRDLLALLPLLSRRTPDVALLAEEIDLLCDLGLVAVGTRLEIPAEPLEAFQRLDRAEKLRRHAVGRTRAIPTLAPFFQLLSLTGPVPLFTLVELAELDASAEPTLWRRGRARTLDGATRVDLLLLQPGLGLADVGNVRLVGMAPSLHAALSGQSQPEPEAHGQPHLLPSQEAIVPPECPLTLLVELGRFLEVESVDAVARLKLTRESVERAARRGLTPEAMQRTLAGVAQYGVPENVARALKDFSQVKQNRVEVVDGPVILAQEPNVQLLLRHDEELKELVTEVGPGVFEIQGPWATGPARRRLTQLGLWSARDEEPQETPRLTRWDLEDARKRLVHLRQGAQTPGSATLARRARAALELGELGPGLPGAPERIQKARKALTAKPELFELFLSQVEDSEREALRARVDRLLDPGVPLIDQLDRLDRLASDWVERAKPRKARKPRTVKKT